MVSQSLQEPRYGMSSREHLPAEYRRVVSHRYFEILQRARVVSLLRIIPGVSLQTYAHNILEYLKQPALKNHTFCDLGLYHLDSEVDRAAVVRDCVDFAVSYAQAHGHAGLYIHVPLPHAGHYRQHGFSIAGGPFQPEGWTQTYVPMIRITAPELQSGPEKKTSLSIVDDK